MYTQIFNPKLCTVCKIKTDSTCRSILRAAPLSFSVLHKWTRGRVPCHTCGCQEVYCRMVAYPLMSTSPQTLVCRLQVIEFADQTIPKFLFAKFQIEKKCFLIFMKVKYLVQYKNSLLSQCVLQLVLHVNVSLC